MIPHTLTRQQSRKVDRVAIEQYGFSGLVLMENAGRGVVDVLLDVDPDLVGTPDRLVNILCGKGNNAGDGFVIARHLEIRNVRSQVFLLAPAEQLAGDALANLEILRHTNVPISDLSDMQDPNSELASVDEKAWIVDAMLGTGAIGEPREPFASAIAWMNQQPARRLAIDVPSGLDCDTGTASKATVRADHTCTFVAAKQGFQQPAAREFLGCLHLVSIGVPQRICFEL